MLRVFRREFLHHLVHRQNLIVTRIAAGEIDVTQRHPLSPATVPLRLPPTGPVDEDRTHGRRRRCKKMRAILSAAQVLAAESQPCFMHERGRLQRLVRLAPQLMGRHPAQLAVDEGDQLVTGPRIPARHLLQQSRDVVHAPVMTPAVETGHPENVARRESFAPGISFNVCENELPRFRRPRYFPWRCPPNRDSTG
jgi:hypothetical protein